MKTTIDVPDALYRDVKAEAARRGLTVHEVTQALYEAWLRGDAPAPPPAHTPPDEAAVARWIDEMKAMARRFSEQDPTPGMSILDQLRRDRDARG